MPVTWHAHRVRGRAARDGGFTLVELVVAMAVGIVVLFALSAVMIVALHQSQRTFTRIDATRQARTALAKIENELHSACLVGSPLTERGADPPIEAGSDSDLVNFLNYEGAAASPTPVWHELSLTGGNLVDTTYNVTGTSPTWAQGSKLTSTTLVSNTSTQPGVPAFRYYAYQRYTDSSGNPYWMVPDGTNAVPGTTGPAPNAPLTAPLAASDADDVVEVVINLLVGASSQNLNDPSLSGAATPVTDSISLRITTPPDSGSGAGASQYGPCA